MVAALPDSPDLHVVAGGIHHLAVANVYPDVVDRSVEEDEVPRLQLVFRHVHSVAVLHSAGVWQVDTDLAIGVFDQAGAIEAAGARGSPDVGHADVLEGDVDHLRRFVAVVAYGTATAPAR